MTEWMAAAKLAMDICEEKARSRREPILLHQPGFAVVRTFVLHLIRLSARPAGTARQGLRRAHHVAG